MNAGNKMNELIEATLKNIQTESTTINAVTKEMIEDKDVSENALIQISISISNIGNYKRQIEIMLNELRKFSKEIDNAAVK